MDENEKDKDKDPLPPYIRPMPGGYDDGDKPILGGLMLVGLILLAVSFICEHCV